MASAGSKGLTKRHSALQKDHFKSHSYRLKENKLARLKRHLLRGLRKRDRQIIAGRERVMEIDKQAVRAYEKLGGNYDALGQQI